MPILELDKICKGLKSVGLASFPKCNEIFVCKAFSSTKEVHVSADNILKKIKIHTFSGELSDNENNSLCWFKKVVSELPTEEETGIINYIKK